MPGEGIKRIDTNREAAFERTLKRFEGFETAYDRMIGSRPVSFEDRGKEYLTIAGDVPALKSWYQAQAQIHGAPRARSMLLKMAKDGEKFIDEL